MNLKCTKHTENTNISKESNINKGNWLKRICLTFNFVAYCESIVKQNIFMCVYDLQQRFNLIIQYNIVTIFISLWQQNLNSFKQKSEMT